MAIVFSPVNKNIPRTGLNSIVMQGLTTWGDPSRCVALPGVKKYFYGKNYSVVNEEDPNLVLIDFHGWKVEEPNRALARTYVEGRPGDIVAEAAHRLKRLKRFDSGAIMNALKSNPYYEPWMENDIKGLIDGDADDMMY